MVLAVLGQLKKNTMEKTSSCTAPGSTDDPNVQAVFMGEHGIVYSCFSEQYNTSSC